MVVVVLVDIIIILRRICSKLTNDKKAHAQATCKQLVLNTHQSYRIYNNTDQENITVFITRQLLPIITSKSIESKGLMLYNELKC